MGHEFRHPGIYTTRDLAVSMDWYARPANLFDDFAMLQFVFEIVPQTLPVKSAAAGEALAVLIR